VHRWCGQATWRRGSKLNDTRWRLSATVLAALLLPAVLFAYRLALPVRYVAPGSGDKVFTMIPALYLVALLAALVVVLVDSETLRRVVGVRWAWVGFACLAADAAVYLLAGWSERSLKLAAALALPSLASLACLAVGAFLWRRRPGALHGLVAASVIASAVAGVLQMAERSGLSTPPGAWLVAWDRFAAERFLTSVNPSRAQGFELNPNMYAPMAVLGLLWALLVMGRGRLRTATVVASIAIVIASQSRIALLIGALLLTVATAQWVANNRRAPALGAVAKIALGATLVVIALMVARYGPVAVTESGVVRQPAGIEIPSGLSDESMTGRFEVWHSTAAAIAKHPWGVLQDYRRFTAPLSHPHNEALFRLLYAGPLWLAVHAILIVWLALWFRLRAYPWIGVAFALVLFAQGLTEVLFTKHPYTVLFFLMVGAMMWEQTDQTAD